MQAVKLQRVYNRLAHTYDKREAIVEFLVLKNLRRAHFAKAKGLVLDVAVGTGKNLPHYPEETEVVGIDLSQNMLNHAKRRTKQSGHSHFLIMDAQNLGFRDTAFDTVASSMSMCTVPDPVRAMEEMRRVVKPNKRILLLEHGLSKIRWVAKLQHASSSPSVKRVGCHPDRDHLANVFAAGLHLTASQTRLLDVIKLIEASKSNHGTSESRHYP